MKSFRCVGAAGEWMEVFMPAGSVCHADGCPGQCNASGDCVAAPCPPTTPGSLLAKSGITLDSYVLSWTSAQRAQRYELIEYIVAGGSTSTAYSGSGLQQTFTAKPASEYRYTVRACNSAGCSSSSPAAVLTVPASPASIVAPAQTTSGAYALSWSAVTGTSSYQVLEAGKSALSVTATTLAVTGKVDGTYRYRIRSCNSLVCGPYSAEVSVTVFRIPPAPAPLVASATTTTTGRYTLSWRRPASYAVDGYRLERRVGTGPWTTLHLGVSEGFAETQATSGVYSYRVSAFNAAGTSPAAGPVSVTVAIPTPTPEPQPNPNPYVPEQAWVGALPGSPSVDGGAAKYGIPIEVPPGRNGVQPSVDLTYGSRGGNGVAGVGWAVSGSSLLYRCPTMLARSGKNAPVLHQLSDKLCFDGQQLVRSGGTNYGSAGAEYHTEVDSFARVTQGGGDIQSWSSYFRVEHKDGRVGIYQALGSNARNPVPDTWRLVREFDPHGNCLDFRYALFSSRSGGGEEWVLDRVAYTGMRSSAGSSSRVGDSETCVVAEPARAVAFEYATRPDVRTTYDTGAANLFTARLSAITTWVGASAQRRYELAYDQSAATGRSLLSAVTACAGSACGAAKLPPTRFTYQQDMATFTWERPFDASGSPMGADWQNQLAADFDGDGARDIEFRHLVGGAWTREIQLTSCGTSKFNLGTISATPNLLQSADLDNDGKAELLGVQGNQVVQVKLSCSAGSAAAAVTAIANLPTLGARTLPPHAQDYDGDGRIDLAHSYADSAGTYRTRICLRTSAVTPTWNCSAGIEKPLRPSSVEGEVFERDLNGDGRVDVLFDTNVTTSGSASIAFYMGGTTWDRRSLASLGGPSTTFTGAAAKYIWLDVNGDGLQDIYQSGNPTTLSGTLWINRGGTPGAGMFRAVQVGALGVDLKRLPHARAMDIDGDGSDELLIPDHRTIGYCGGPGMPTCPGSQVPTCTPGEPCQIPEDTNPADPPPAGGSGSTSQCEAASGNNAWCGDEFDCPGAADSWDYSVFHWNAYRLRETASGTYSVSSFDPQLEAPIHYPATAQEDFFGDGMSDLSFRLVDTWVTCLPSGTRIKRGYYNDQESTLRGPIIARNRARAPDLLVRADAGATDQQSSGSYGVSAAWSYYPLSVDSYWSFAAHDHPNACATAGASFYEVDSGGPPPAGYAYFTSSMWTAAQLDVSNGSPNGPELNTTCYRYQDAMLNLEGRGFQGFRSITAEERFAPASGESAPPASTAQQGPCGQSSSCSANNRVSTSTFHQEYPLAGRLKSTAVALASDPGKRISSETFTWQALDTSWSGKVVAPLSHVVERHDLEPDWLTRQTTISDQFDPTSGEVTRTCSILQHSPAAVASVHAGTTVQDTIQTETREVENLTSDWWLGRLKAVNTVSDVFPGPVSIPAAACPSTTPSSEAKAARTEYTWYSSPRRLLEKERLLVKGVEESLTTIAAYDGFGHPTSRSVTARGATGGPFTTALGYSSPGSYFPETETNPAGHTSRTTFDPGTGSPLTKQAVQGGPVTRLTYDSLGRLLTTATDGAPPIHERVASCGDCGEIVLSRQTIQAGAPTRVEFLDRLGRVVQTQTTAFDGKPIVSAVEYNERGAKVAEYPPYVCPSTGCPADTGAFSPFPIVHSSIDALGRVGRKTVERSAALFSSGQGQPTLVTDYAFSGLNTLITVHNPVGKALAMSRAYDGRGKLVETMQKVTDASGLRELVTRYRYDPAGSVTHIIDSKGNDLAASYDDLGRKIRVDDPDRGTWTYTWDGLGRLTSQRDAKGTQLMFGYDPIGRMTSRHAVLPGETTWRLEATWGYDESGFTGYPTSVVGKDIRPEVPATETTGVPFVTTDQYRRELHYDALRRQDRVTTHILLNPGGAAAPVRVQTMAVDYGYDATFGWLRTVRYPTGEGIYLDYNTFGYRRGEAQLLADGSRGPEYRRVTEMTARGKVAQQKLWRHDGQGNPAGHAIDYLAQFEDSFGLMVSEAALQPAGSVLRTVEYSHDHFLNLASQDLTLPAGTGVGGFSETFTYDELQRLRGAARSWSGALSRGAEQTVYEYDELGNITRKGDYADRYVYGSSSRSTRLGGPHAVVELTGKKDGSSAQFQYDLNGNLVSGDRRTIDFDHLDRPRSVTLDGATDSFWYAPDGTRFMQRAPGKTVYYLDKDVEYYFYDTGAPKTKLYLSDAVQVNLDDSAPRQVYYKVFDRLGSLLATTDLSGLEQPADGHAFDAFGGPRAANGFPSGDRLHPVSDHGTVTNNGFTGHEHLDDVYLIHMNGRMYDYRLGRFLSVDPIISNPASSQSINPYSYIGNNPLNGVDPTGYEWNLLTSVLEYVDSFIGTSVSTPSSNGATGRSLSGGSVTDAESPSAVSKDTNWGAVATGAAFGTLQAIVPGGVLAGSPAPTNPDFEAGRAAGLIATGTVQAVVGAAEAVAGAGVGVVTSPTGVGAVAGGAVAVAGAVVVVQGVANVIVGADVAAHAMEMRSSGDGGGSKTAKEMGQELAAEGGGNRVSATTAGGKKVDIDLQGKGHFDKAIGKKIDTPHVHESKVNKGPDGKTSTSDKTTRPATKDDIRTARKIRERK